jgi:hypothetical protein
VEGHHMFVLCDHPRGDLPRHDFAEDAGHGA